MPKYVVAVAAMMLIMSILRFASASCSTTIIAVMTIATMMNYMCRCSIWVHDDGDLIIFMSVGATIVRMFAHAAVAATLQAV
ncbi:MAG TPA: hypothetical protein V6C81_16275 [Planktothrix sp.]